MADNQINIESTGHLFKGQITDEIRDLVKKITEAGVDLTKWKVYVTGFTPGYYKGDPPPSPYGATGWIGAGMDSCGADRTTLNFMHISDKDFGLSAELLALSEEIHNTPGIKSTFEVLQTGINNYPKVEDGQVQYVWYKKNGVTQAYQAFHALIPEMCENEFVFIFDDYILDDLVEKGEYDETRVDEMLQAENGPHIEEKMKYVDSDKRDIKVTIIAQDIAANEQKLIELIEGLDDALDD